MEQVLPEFSPEQLEERRAAVIELDSKGKRLEALEKLADQSENLDIPFNGYEEIQKLRAEVSQIHYHLKNMVPAGKVEDDKAAVTKEGEDSRERPNVWECLQKGDFNRSAKMVADHFMDDLDCSGITRAGKQMLRDNLKLAFRACLNHLKYDMEGVEEYYATRRDGGDD